MRADFVLWDVQRPAELSYALGANPCARASFTRESLHDAQPRCSFPAALDIAQLRRLAGNVPANVQLDPACRPGMRASAAVVRRAADGDAPVYGVNTGFGKLASTRIDAADLERLQLNLLRSHAVGVGEPLPRAWCA